MCVHVLSSVPRLLLLSRATSHEAEVLTLYQCTLGVRFHAGYQYAPYHSLSLVARKRVKDSCPMAKPHPH